MAATDRKSRTQVNVAELEPHPACAAFPMLSDSELDQLAGDIKANGQRHPIIIYSGWKILDGRNRLEACRRAGVDPIFHDVINEMESGDDDEIVRYVISTNLHRRHLDASQRAIVAGRLANLTHGGNRKDQAAGLPVEGVTQAQAAELLNVSERSVRDAVKVLREAPELADKVSAGDMKVSTAAATVRKASADPAIPTDYADPLPAIPPAPARDFDKILEAGNAKHRLERHWRDSHAETWKKKGRALWRKMTREQQLDFVEKFLGNLEVQS
ncbi:MAG: ParB/RepB/Spo0J family partition protein [Xanthomonadales bacterium]|jgi:ParB-like chromosome segregation protein Spo0J|nr:ParB/RepB/Spo0J family partition protein [Xanthomonadales bacterium]